MRSLKLVLFMAVLAMTLMANGMASADSRSRDGGHHGGHHRGGVDVMIGGGPFWGPSWYYPQFYYPYYPFYPYYYPEIAEPMPPEYIEQGQPERSSRPSGVWYYCPQSKAYYPYVKECPDGWQTVPEQPYDEIEKNQPGSLDTPSDGWYYCPESRAYYPYVKECPGGWQTVAPQPPSGLVR